MSASSNEARASRPDKATAADGAGESLALDPLCDFATFETLGNTGSAALPLTMALGIERGHLRPREHAALLGIGSGINTLMLAVDGVEPTEMRRIMQLELENQIETQEKVTTVFEAAGGYSPTVGIIGAVLGLIQVMQHLDNISEVGRGIAVAFVATIYGVGLANLVCLPIAGKLKIRYREEQVVKEMILEGVVSILEGMNPRMLEMKLRTFLDTEQPRELQETMA